MNPDAGAHDVSVGIGTVPASGGIVERGKRYPKDPKWHISRFVELGDGDIKSGLVKAFEDDDYATDMPDDLLDDLMEKIYGPMDYVGLPRPSDEDDEEKALAVDTDPDPSPKPGARRLREYWTRGEGAAKIKWNTPGDWTRCTKHLGKYVGPENAKGLCSIYHKVATGMYPGDKRNKKSAEDYGVELTTFVQQTKAWAEDGIALPDGSFPIPDRSTLELAIPMLKLAQDQEVAQKHIIDRAHALGCEDMLPDTWNTKGAEDMDMEFKSVGVSGVSEPESGVLEAIVSVTGVVDRVNDVIAPGAYEKTLKTRLPKGIWSHSWDSPVSKTLEVKELMPGDPQLPSQLSNGEPWPAHAGALKVKMQFNLDTQRGRDAYSDIQFYGDQQEWSIGYQVPVGASTVDNKSGVRTINHLELYEYSPVLFGAMPATHTTSVKEAQLAMKSLMESKISAPTVPTDRDPVEEEDLNHKAETDVVEPVTTEEPTFVDAVTRYLGDEEGKPTSLSEIYDWARTADDAGDDDVEVDALSGMLTTVNGLLGDDTEPDFKAPLTELRDNLSLIFDDFDAGDDAGDAVEEAPQYNDTPEPVSQGEKEEQVVMSIKDIESLMDATDSLMEFGTKSFTSAPKPSRKAESEPDDDDPVDDDDDDDEDSEENSDDIIDK